MVQGRGADPGDLTRIQPSRYGSGWQKKPGSDQIRDPVSTNFKKRNTLSSPNMQTLLRLNLKIKKINKKYY